MDFIKNLLKNKKVVQGLVIAGIALAVILLLILTY